MSFCHLLSIWTICWSYLLKFSFPVSPRYICEIAGAIVWIESNAVRRWRPIRLHSFRFRAKRIKDRNLSSKLFYSVGFAPVRACCFRKLTKRRAWTSTILTCVCGASFHCVSSGKRHDKMEYYESSSFPCRKKTFIESSMYITRENEIKKKKTFVPMTSRNRRSGLFEIKFCSVSAVNGGYF